MAKLPLAQNVLPPPPWWQRLYHHCRDQFLRPKRLAIAEAVLIGFVAAIAAVLLKQLVGILGAGRVALAGIYPAWLVLPGIGGLGGLTAGWLIVHLAAEASGSGIPQVKAALAYVPIALNFRVGLAKMLATVVSLASGFALGRQGPTVQISAALANGLSKLVPTSPEYQRQLIAAGAAAGLAAGFNAPLAGVMYVIEDLLQDVSGLTPSTAIIASLIGGVISRQLGGQSLRLETLSSSQFMPAQIPYLVVLGLVIGLVASLLQYLVITSIKLSRRHLKLSFPLRMAGAGIASGLVIAFLPSTFRDSTELHRFLATGDGSFGFTAIAFGIRFLLTLIACSAEAPGGLFFPSLVFGAALGSLVGNAEALFDPNWIATDLYALAGMGAFFGAVARVPITAILIVFEITANFNLVLPLMICSVIAYLVTGRLTPIPLYTELLALKGISLEPVNQTNALWTSLTAEDVMQTQVETLPSDMTLGQAMVNFAQSHHRGFPVVEQAKLVGIITQADLAKAQERQLDSQVAIAALMTPNPVTVKPTDNLAQVLHLLTHLKLSRLPVLDHGQLIGIITRSDILRAEAAKLKIQDRSLVGSSYLVYRTQNPAGRRPRLLLWLDQSANQDHLIELALNLARHQDLDLECLQTLIIPLHSNPDDIQINLEPWRSRLEQITQIGKGWQVAVHTQIQICHQAIEPMLQVINQYRIQLLIMEWQNLSPFATQLFGDLVTELNQRSNCGLVLVKFARDYPSNAWQKWLISVAGGPNSTYALSLLPALLGDLVQPEVALCQVFSPSDPEHDIEVLENGRTLLSQHHLEQVDCIALCATSVSEAIQNLANQTDCDVVVLGATCESIVHQILQGDIANAIAQDSSRATILVKKPGI
ncbi:MAG: chloride channel protein [Pseudanabaenaceae cyanobacterium bins.68]|nr:chloride channel protein [Pseudanabaenaceae cyanobacterium bins.68]